MSNRAIFMVGAAVAAVVAVVVFRGARSGGATDVGTALANGAGALTTKQKQDIMRRPTGRAGRLHF